MHCSHEYADDVIREITCEFVETVGDDPCGWTGEVDIALCTCQPAGQYECPGCGNTVEL